MLPMKALRLKLGTLLAADATTLAPATDANLMKLVKAPFALQENLVFDDLTYADFDGGNEIAGATGPQLVGTDPVTLAQVLEIKPPLGGYRWITTGLTNLPQTIYGFALYNDAADTLFAVGELQPPITLTEVGQFIDIDSVNMTFVPVPLA